jgi:hypothetical protein
MASPRKQRKLDDEASTPQKVGILILYFISQTIFKSNEQSSSAKLLFTPVQSFDWAELSAKEYELRANGTPSKAEDEEEVEDSEFPPLNLSQGPNMKCPDSGGPANRTRSRKKPTPKRVDTTNK